MCDEPSRDAEQVGVLPRSGSLGPSAVSIVRRIMRMLGCPLRKRHGRAPRASARAGLATLSAAGHRARLSPVYAWRRYPVPVRGSRDAGLLRARRWVALRVRVPRCFLTKAGGRP